MKVLWPETFCRDVTFTPQRGWLIAEGPQNLHVHDPATGRNWVIPFDLMRSGPTAPLHLSHDERLLVVDHHLLDLGPWWDWVDLSQGEMPKLTPWRTLMFDPCTIVWNLSDGRILSSHKGRIHVLERERVRVLLERDHPVHWSSMLEISPDGSHMAWQQGQWVLVEPLAGGERVQMKLSNYSFKEAFSPDGQMLAMATCSPSKVSLWTLAGENLATFKAFRSHAHGLAFHPTGRVLAAACGGELRLYDVAARREIARLELGIPSVIRIAFSPDGCLGAAAGGKGVVLWDMDELLPA